MVLACSSGEHSPSSQKEKHTAKARWSTVLTKKQREGLAHSQPTFSSPQPIHSLSDFRPQDAVTHIQGGLFLLIDRDLASLSGNSLKETSKGVPCVSFSSGVLMVAFSRQSVSVQQD